ncbi:MAG: Rpn family recombination-promoting nuclease/putative transposase [Alkalispirochaeta sp.]
MKSKAVDPAGFGGYEPIRLTSDYVFKYVFGSETSTGILRSFLSAVQTDAGLPAVAEVEIRNPFNPAAYFNDKTSVVDVRARDINGIVYTVEVQALPETAFKERALYYWAHAYAGQLGKGQDYESLCPVVGVNIVDFTIFPNKKPVHTTFYLIPRPKGNIDDHHDHSLNVLTDHLAIHFLELPKLQSQLQPRLRDNTAKPAEAPHVSTTLLRWLYYMHERGEVNAMEDPILLQILREDPDIEDAEERYRQFVADDELREKYQDRIKAERDRRSQIIYATKKALAEGREEGAWSGRLAVAKKLKARGLSEEEIASLTELPIEEIHRLE